MRVKKPVNVWRWPLVATAASIAVLVVSGVVVLRLSSAAASETRSSFKWTTHTLEVQNELHGMLGALEHAESAQRGFVLTSDEVYLGSFTPAADSAVRLLSTLRALTSDNRDQQVRLDTLDRLVARRLALLRLGLNLAGAGNHDSVSRLIKSGRGRAVMDSVRATMQHANAAEQVLLTRRQQAVEAALGRRRLAESLTAAIALLSLVLAGVAWLWLRRAEKMVTLCAWSKAIKYDGEWMSIETYMLRQYGIRMTHGISPAEAARLEYGERQSVEVP